VMRRRLARRGLLVVDGRFIIEKVRLCLLASLKRADFAAICSRSRRRPILIRDD